MYYPVTPQSDPAFIEPFLASQETEERAASILESNWGTGRGWQYCSRRGGRCMEHIYGLEKMVGGGGVREFSLVPCHIGVRH